MYAHRFLYVRQVLLVGVMQVIVLLAGCIGPGLTSPPDGLTDDAPVAMQRDADNLTTVNVDVVNPVDEEDHPVSGAHVVFFTELAPNTWDVAYFRNITHCNRSLNDAPFEVLASAVTTSNGRVVGKVNPNAWHPSVDFPLPIYVAVVGPANYTTEVYVDDIGMALPCGFHAIDRDRGRDGSTHITVQVYPDSVPIELNGTIEITDYITTERAESRFERWYPRPVYENSAHLERLDRVRAEMEWSNGADGWGDLFLGFGGTGTVRPAVIGQDKFQGPFDRDNNEILDTRVRYVAEGVSIGPMTERPTFTVEGLSYRITGTLGFKGALLDVPVSA